MGSPHSLNGGEAVMMIARVTAIRRSSSGKKKVNNEFMINSRLKEIRLVTSNYFKRSTDIVFDSERDSAAAYLPHFQTGLAYVIPEK